MATETENMDKMLHGYGGYAKLCIMHNNPFSKRLNNGFM